MMKRHGAEFLRRYLKISAHPYEGLPVMLASGVGRSGTTALRHCLSAHPDLHGTGCENNIIFDVLATANHNCTSPSRLATMLVARPAYDRQFRLLLLNLLWPKPHRGARRPAMLLATTDLTADRAAYFTEAFPNGRIAYIVRNGIEVLSSRISHPNFRETPFEEHCRIWTQAHAMALWASGRPDVALIRHESLLQPESARAAIAVMSQTLGLAFHQGCVDVVIEKHFHPTAFAAEQREASQDLRQRQDRWRLWSAEQRAGFQAVCGEAMEYFGYPIPW